MYSLQLIHPETGKFIGKWNYLKNIDEIFEIVNNNFPPEKHIPRTVLRNLASPAMVEKRNFLKEKSKICKIEKIEGKLIWIKGNHFLMKNDGSLFLLET